MFEKLKKIPSSDEVLLKLPLPESLKRLKEERDREVADVISGKSRKFLLIAGPCSAHEEAPVLEYVRRLGKLNLKVKDKLVLVPRIYSSKSRTRGVGYMGMISQPDLNSPEDFEKGIYAVRKLNIEAMQISGLTAADEMLYPENYPYFHDLFSYIAVGARSCENQFHRLVASGLNVPVGFKNPTGGSVPVMLNSVFAARAGHTFKFDGWQVKTGGNPLAHCVLRGASDQTGNRPNYGVKDVLEVVKEYEKCGLSNPAVIIDANHSNSGKNFNKQIEICRETVENRLKNDLFGKTVRGLMVESFLVEGCQSENFVFGKSITDPCLGWEDTERLIMEIAQKI